MARGTRLRHARRGEGCRQARVAPPGCSATSWSSKAPPPTACWTASWPRSHAALNARPDAQALVTAVVAAVLLVPGDVRTRLLIGNLVVLALAVIDWALAPPRVAVERRLPGVLALGQRGTIEWRLRNPTAARGRGRRAGALAPRRLRPALRLPPHGGSTATTHVVPASRPLRDHRDGRAGARPVRARRPSAGEAGARRAAGVPAVPVPAGGRAPHRQGAHPGGGAAIGQGSRRRDRVRPAAGLHGGRRVRRDWAATARSAKPIVRTCNAEQARPC